MLGVYNKREEVCKVLISWEYTPEENIRSAMFESYCCILKCSSTSTAQESTTTGQASAIESSWMFWVSGWCLVVGGGERVRSLHSKFMTLAKISRALNFICIHTVQICECVLEIFTLIYEM